MLIVSAIIVNILIAASIYVYNRLTCGICKCSKHLVGRVVIVTGGNAGIGYETAKDMAERGAKVIIATRSESRGTAARDKIIKGTGNSDVHFMQLDLSSFASIRKFAVDFIKNEKRLDILINNAGVVDFDKSKTEDGLLFVMQTNHFGPFLLTNLLLPLLKASAPSRIVNVSSMAHKNGKLDFSDLNLDKVPKEKYGSFQAYGNSKVCNVLMTRELAKRLEGTGVTTNSLHPGVIRTNIVKEENFQWWMKLMGLFAWLFLKSTWEGAQTTIYLAVSPEVENVSGDYFVDCQKARISKLAQDDEVARKLWEVSERLTKY